jgi:uncharacterized phage infection (PIP) family protein YhgE
MEENDLKELISGLNEANDNLSLALESIKKLVNSRNNLKTDIDKFNTMISNREGSLNQASNDLSQTLTVLSDQLEDLSKEINDTRKKVADSTKKFEARLMSLAEKNDNDNQIILKKLNNIISSLEAKGLKIEINETLEEVSEEIVEYTKADLNNLPETVDVITYDYVRKSENDNEPKFIRSPKNGRRSVLLLGHDSNNISYEFRTYLGENETFNDINNELTNKTITIKLNKEKIYRYTRDRIEEEYKNKKVKSK